MYRYTGALPWRPLADTPRIDRRHGAGGGISCAEGDSGPPRDGCEPSWARPCEASGALFLSNGGTGGGHAACTLWPPPAPFGYFPARGKYLVRPQADETSHKKLIPCGRQGKEPFLLSPYRKRFRLCGGDQRAFRSPFGNLRPFAAHGGFHKKQIPCGRQEKKPSWLFPVSRKVSPLRRRPGGFPIAPWTPSGAFAATGNI